MFSCALYVSCATYRVDGQINICYTEVGSFLIITFSWKK